MIFNRSRVLIVLAFLFFTIGCASTVKMDQAVWESLENAQSLKVAHYTLDSFMVATTASHSYAAAGIMFGAIGGGIGGALAVNEAISAGEELVEKYDLEDPVFKLKDDFISSMIAHNQVGTIDSVEEALTEDDLDDFQSQFPEEIVLDFKTMGWSIGTLLGDSNGVDYLVRALLIQVAREKVLWQDTCQVDGTHEVDELTANEGKLLKAQLTQVAETCYKEL